MKFQIWKKRNDKVEVEEFDYDDLDGLPMAHCDSLILHAPGECEFCDHYPQAQRLRDWWHINFTNHHDPDRLPCPSTLRRSDATRDLWGGNRAVSTPSHKEK